MPRGACTLISGNIVPPDGRRIGSRTAHAVRNDPVEGAHPGPTGARRHPLRLGTSTLPRVLTARGRADGEGTSTSRVSPQLCSRPPRPVSASAGCRQRSCTARPVVAHAPRRPLPRLQRHRRVPRGRGGPRARPGRPAPLGADRAAGCVRSFDTTCVPGDVLLREPAEVVQSKRTFHTPLQFAASSRHPARPERSSTPSPH